MKLIYFQILYSKQRTKSIKSAFVLPVVYCSIPPFRPILLSNYSIIHYSLLFVLFIINYPLELTLRTIQRKISQCSFLIDYCSRLSITHRTHKPSFLPILIILLSKTIKSIYGNGYQNIF